jgi:hypothetical protein
MLIALLALLGVNLAALLALAALFRNELRAAHGDDAELLVGPYRELLGTATNSQTPSVRH